MIHTGPPTREFIPCDPNRIRGAAFSGPSGVCKPLAPACCRDPGHAELLGNHQVTDTLSRQQHDLGPYGIGACHLATA